MSDFIKNLIWYTILGSLAAFFLAGMVVGLWSFRPKHVSNPELLKLSVFDAAQGMKNGSVNVKDYLENIVERIYAKTNLNAFTTHDVFPLTTHTMPSFSQKADPKAKPQPLLGVPFGVADNINSNKYPTSAGVRSLASWFPVHNALIVDYLIDAGALLIGKTNLAELNFGFTGANHIDGQVKNAFNSDCIGGTGAAVAVASHSIPFAIASDFMGQLRTSAAMNGVVGFRPSYGRYPMEGVVTLSPTLDTVGIVAHSARDVSLVDSVITQGQLAREPGIGQIKLAVPRGTSFYQAASVEVLEVVENALRLLQSKGVQLNDDSNISPSHFAGYGNGSTIVQYEAIRSIAAYTTKYNTPATLYDIITKISTPELKAFLALSASDKLLQTTYLNQILQRSTLIQEAFAAYFQSNNAMAMAIPTILSAAPKIKDIQNHNATTANIGQNSFLTSIAGLPSITIPVGVTKSGLPVGLELVGQFKDDDRLLAVARTMQKVFPVAEPSSAL